MKAEQFIDLLEYAAPQGSVRSYSGRFMYGKRCVSVNIDRGESLEALCGQLVLDAERDNEGDGDEVVRILRQTRTDNMGLGTVAYWPNIQWPEGREEQDGDE